LALDNPGRTTIQKFIKIPITVHNFIKWQHQAPITDVQPLNTDVLLNFFKLYKNNDDGKVRETACRKNRTGYQVTNYTDMFVHEVVRYTNILIRHNIPTSGKL
jgi:hypothetical protein